MNQRETIIRLWFDMWLKKADLGIENVFTDDVTYIESWGPEYHGLSKIKLWFEECIKRQDVLEWSIRQFFHKDNQTVVQWFFRYRDVGEFPNSFEGMSAVQWTEDNRIVTLQEYGCNGHRYDPYKNGTTPQFAIEKPLWF